MEFIPIKTRPVRPPKDDIYQVLEMSLPRLQEKDVLFITSKVLAIHQGRCVKIGPAVNKHELIKKEAERYLENQTPFGQFILTIKNHTLIPSAGIDESNGNGYYILWPERPWALVQEICLYLKKKFHLKNLAVIATDSHTIPLRFGVVGISVGFYGLEPMLDYRGKPDIFGRPLKYTKTNIVDALAAMAVLLMGEADEQTPLLVLRKAKFIDFSNRSTYPKLMIPHDQDLYRPLLEVFGR